MLSYAASKISSVNSLGTMLFVLEVDDDVVSLRILVGRLSVSSHGHTTFSRKTGDWISSGVLQRGIYGSNSTSAKTVCSVLKILYSMLMAISAVKGLTSVKKMRDASLNIWRRCAVVTTLRPAHFLLKLRTSRKKIQFSAVNSRAAAQAMRGSMLCSMLNSSACIDTLVLADLSRLSIGDFSTKIDREDLKESVSEIEERRYGCIFSASRRGMTIKTCWQTISDGMNLFGRVSIKIEALRAKPKLTILLVQRIY